MKKTIFPLLQNLPLGLGLLALLPLSGCYHYAAPTLERHLKTYAAQESKPPCTELIALDEHSSYSMRLLAICLEKGWGEQHPVYLDAADAYTRAARCGDEESLSWLKTQGESTADEKAKFLLVKERILGAQAKVEKLDPSGPSMCRLRLERTSWWYVVKPFDLLLHVFTLPLCLTLDYACPSISEMPAEYYEKPTGYLGKFYRPSFK